MPTTTPQKNHAPFKAAVPQNGATLPIDRWEPSYYDDVVQVLAKNGEWWDYATVKDETDARLAVRLVSQNKDHRIKHAHMGRLTFFARRPR